MKQEYLSVIFYKKVNLFKIRNRGKVTQFF